MTGTRSRRLAVLAAVGALALALFTPGVAAYADDTSELQARVDAVLAEFPGGSQTAPNEVTWEDGAVILTLAADEGLITTMAVGSCATGYYCAYSGYNLSGSKLSFSAIALHPLRQRDGAARQTCACRSARVRLRARGDLPGGYDSVS